MATRDPFEGDWELVDGSQPPSPRLLDPQEVVVHFQCPAGELKRCAVEYTASAQDLYNLVRAFSGEKQVRLSIGSEILLPGPQQPLQQVARSIFSPSIQCTVDLPPLGRDQDERQSLLHLVLGSHWSMALQLLRSHRCPRLIARQRNYAGESVLAWASYRAGRRAGSWAPIAVIQELIRLVPSDCAVRTPHSLFLPLHEAAWGNAPVEVAAWLLVANPKALHARCKFLETPHSVGRYYHGRRFRWPPPEELELIAGRLRLQEQQHSRLSCLRRFAKPSEDAPKPRPKLHETLAQALRLPDGAAALVAGFLVAMPSFEVVATTADEDCKPPPERLLRRASQAEWSGHLRCSPWPKPQRSDGLVRRRQRPQRVRPSDPRIASYAAGAVEIHFREVHLQEPSVKERGRLAGAREVRNRICAFKEIGEVWLTGEKSSIHLYRFHTVKRVRQDIEHSPVEPKWPFKQWQLDRAADRDWKRDEAEGHVNVRRGKWPLETLEVKSWSDDDA